MGLCGRTELSHGHTLNFDFGGWGIDPLARRPPPKGADSTGPLRAPSEWPGGALGPKYQKTWKRAVEISAARVSLDKKTHSVPPASDRSNKSTLHCAFGSRPKAAMESRLGVFSFWLLPLPLTLHPWPLPRPPIPLYEGMRAVGPPVPSRRHSGALLVPLLFPCSRVRYGRDAQRTVDHPPPDPERGDAAPEGPQVRWGALVVVRGVRVGALVSAGPDALALEHTT